MPLLILDLDETVILDQNSTVTVDPSHTLSNILYKIDEPNGCTYYFRIINEKEIASLIEFAYRKGDGVMILTSGCWSDKIRVILAAALNLSPSTREKFMNCRFHSATTDTKLINLPIEYIQYMSKSERLNHIIKCNPDLKGMKFVLLDDNTRHCLSFMMCDFVSIAYVKIDRPGKHFYTVAQNALQNWIYDINQNRETIGDNTESVNNVIGTRPKSTIQSTSRNSFYKHDIDLKSSLSKNNSTEDLAELMFDLKI